MAATALSDVTGREPVTDTNQQLEVRGPPPSVTDRYYTKYYALGKTILVCSRACSSETSTKFISFV